MLACGGDPPPVKNPDPPLDNRPAKPPVRTPLTFNSAVQAFEAGNLPEAKKGFQEAIAEVPFHAESHAYLGLIAEKEGDAKGAETHYVEALKFKHELESAAENLSALYIDQSRFQEAVRVADAALKIHPENAALHLNMGIALASTGDAFAAEQFDLALKGAPKDPTVYLTAGHWLGVLKKTDDAKAKLKSASALVPQSPAAVPVLAAIGHEFRLIGAFPECVETLDKAVVQKDVAELRTDRALCKMGQKDDEGTRADLEAAIKADPKYGPAHFYLAGRLAQGGKLKEAQKEYEAFIAIAPNSPMAKQAQDRIQLIKEQIKNPPKNAPKKPAK